MLAKPLLVFSSYAPLFGLLAIRFERLDLRLICIILLLFGIVTPLWLFHFNSQGRPAEHHITERRHESISVLAYLSGYILPLLSVPRPSVADLLVYTGFLSIVVLVSTISDAIQTNPTLYLLGLKIYSVVDSRAFKGFVISRQDVNIDESIWCTRLSNEVLLRSDWRQRRDS